MHRIRSNVRSGRGRLRAPPGRESTYSREGKRRAKWRGWIRSPTRVEIGSPVARSPVRSVSAGGVVPVDRQLRAGDERRLVRGQVQNAVRNVLGFSHGVERREGITRWVQTTSASAVRARDDAAAQSVTRLSPQREAGMRAAQVREPAMRQGVASPRPAVSLGPRGARTGLLEGPPSARSLPPQSPRIDEAFPDAPFVFRMT